MSALPAQAESRHELDVKVMLLSGKFDTYTSLGQKQPISPPIYHNDLATGITYGYHWGALPLTLSVGLYWVPIITGSQGNVSVSVGNKIFLLFPLHLTYKLVAANFEPYAYVGNISNYISIPLFGPSSGGFSPFSPNAGIGCTYYFHPNLGLNIDLGLAFLAINGSSGSGGAATFSGYTYTLGMGMSGRL